MPNTKTLYSEGGNKTIVQNCLQLYEKIMKPVASKRGCCYGDSIIGILHDCQLDNCC